MTPILDAGTVGDTDICYFGLDLDLVVDNYWTGFGLCSWIFGPVSPFSLPFCLTLSWTLVSAPDLPGSALFVLPALWKSWVTWIILSREYWTWTVNVGLLLFLCRLEFWICWIRIVGLFNVLSIYFLFILFYLFLCSHLHPVSSASSQLLPSSVHSPEFPLLDSTIPHSPLVSGASPISFRTTDSTTFCELSRPSLLLLRLSSIADSASVSRLWRFPPLAAAPLVWLIDSHSRHSVQ